MCNYVKAMGKVWEEHHDVDVDIPDNQTLPIDENVILALHRLKKSCNKSVQDVGAVLQLPSPVPRWLVFR